MASGVKELSGRVGIRDMVTFDPLKIRVERNFNPRSPETLRANVDRLKPLIVEAGGVLQPLWVRRDGEDCVLIDGESRLIAVKELLEEEGLPREVNGRPFAVPVLHMAGSSDEASRITLAMTANGGAPLEKWELGKNYARLLNIGLTEKDVATRFGKTAQFIQSCVALNDATEDIKHMLIMGQVSEGKAVQAIKKFGEKASEHISSSPKNAQGKVVREAKKHFDLKALKQAALKIIEEASDQKKSMMVEIHIDTIEQLRIALGQP